ncbi:DUF1905 domain-containing protein [Paracidovorax avenae]|uniref:DUF1905 domain-containing protein n=1 Tax=Paracidovorax avenae TaxID=80867 RepID=UPI001F37FE6B|nr:DUF1905 domain-containing protein [Paracidovorax avenae]
MTTTPRAGHEFSFDAVLENWAEGMDYCAIPVPAEITEELGTKGPVPVLARVNGSEPFQISLFPVGGGRHYIRIKAKVRKDASIRTGDRIKVQITVLERGNVEVPDDLLAALRAAGVLQARGPATWQAKFSGPSHRRSRQGGDARQENSGGRGGRARATRKAEDRAVKTPCDGSRSCVSTAPPIHLSRPPLTPTHALAPWIPTGLCRPYPSRARITFTVSMFSLFVQIEIRASLVEAIAL